MNEPKKIKPPEHDRDIPMFVLYEGDGYSDGEMVYDMAHCPSCNFVYEEDDPIWEMPYCPYCGQRLNWDAG